MSSESDRTSGGGSEATGAHQVTLVARAGPAPSRGRHVEAPGAGSVAPEQVQLTVSPGQAVLEAAEAIGLILPFGCRQGGCTSCAARLMSGELDQTDALALTESMRNGGWVLLCVGRPLSDCVIQVGSGGILHRGSGGWNPGWSPLPPPGGGRSHGPGDLRGCPGTDW